MYKFDRNSLIIVALLLILILTLLFVFINDIEIPFVNWFGDIIYNLLTPILNLFNNIISRIQNFFNILFSINEIQEEITFLRQQNQILERQIMFLSNYDRENKRLRELLNFKEKVEYDMIGAEVIANSPSVFEQLITINRGRRDGLEERMPVITYNGFLVGRIDHVGSSSAQVRLITDNQFVVGGVVARSDSREIGLVRGSGRRDKNNTMDNIAWDADIEIGDVILTSGLSNNFPEGLKIGQIINLETDNYGLSQKAELELDIYSVTIEEVMVIKNF
ncbi:rod shape-determining protein MreC [Halanaerobium sp. Z-7514]|uniref:Cell shape-determining protein MreC n=1 Tax=Halanaerobium polyolivorans TaxID=2886943 RepID=A0AAW4WXS9_9FIRM|nr:rod shape-determining protein MreC [Halanaerobium polyolivorans]MCC3144224.1 rod shape-determining protein MreC [Halanaerobium polyolivorans]RQD75782.1 MAG: rod shape-determining protein MreC [Halanaerobium sp. MSAO_Bac5]